MKIFNFSKGSLLEELIKIVFLMVNGFESKAVKKQKKGGDKMLSGTAIT